MKTEIPLLQQLQQIQWQFSQDLPPGTIGETMKWIINPNSMTQQLRNACHDFKVRVLQEAWLAPGENEKVALRELSQTAFIREVALQCDGEVWVYSRAVFPVTTITGQEQQLLTLGDTPLGEVLYKDPTLRRSGFEIAFIVREDVALKPSWARRSIFFLSEKPLLLTEVFMPNMIEHFSNMH